MKFTELQVEFNAELKSVLKAKQIRPNSLKFPWGSMRFARVCLKKIKMHNPRTKNLSVASQLHFHSLQHATSAPFDLQIFARDQNICQVHCQIVNY
jgi:hypothetical protein